MENALLNTEETFISLQPFENIEQLNENTTAIRELFGEDMTKATREVLDVLSRYSCKYYGLSYLTKNNIAEIVGISRRTVIRACDALESFGVIVQYSLKRHKGDRRQSSNAIVFVDVREDVEESEEEAMSQREVTPACHTVETPYNSPTKTIISNTYVTGDAENESDTAVNEIEEKEQEPKTLNTAKPTALDLLAKSLPNGWYEVASPYVYDYNELHAITGALYKAKSKTNIRIEEYAEEFGEVLRTAWAKHKNGKIGEGKYMAYLFAAFRRKAHALGRSEEVNPILADFKHLIDTPYYD